MTPTTRIVLAIVVIVALGLGAWAYFFEMGIPGLPWTQTQQPPTGGGEGERAAIVENEAFYTIRAEQPARTPLASAEADTRARLTIGQALSARIAEFKRNGNFDNLTAEDIALQRLGEDRKYALVMEYKQYVSPSTGAPAYVSYAYTVYEDTLGAHPNAYFLTFVFDQAGNQVELGSLLASNPNWLEELSLEVSNGVVAQIKERMGDSLPQGDEGPDVTGSVFAEGLAPRPENFQNFYLDGADLVIMIPPYQAAAWAVGSFEVRLPLAGMQ